MVNYAEAVTALEKAREIYESAEINTKAELLLADTHFAAEDYTEAASAYEDFLKQHPGHPETARVLSRLGMSYFNQILAIDRDQTATRNAIVTFESLQRLYPNDWRAKEAPAIIRHCRAQLAEHELYVGRFYLKTGEHRSAVNRLSSIAETFPDFSGLDRVSFYLGQAYLANGHPTLAVKTLEQLLREHPDSDLYAEAEKLLRQEL
ncbi:MAG: outer membrane protein assembly factor BamD [Syntrophotaleaceae bacterium]